MDYKELIEEIRESNVDGDAQIEKWATAIETLRAEREAGWISVEERLPEFYDWVLVSVESVAGPSWIATAYRTRLVSGDWYWWWFGYPSLIGNVTHWMPLPTPP